MGMHTDNTYCSLPSVHEHCENPNCYTLLDTIPLNDADYDY